MTLEGPGKARTVIGAPPEPEHDPIEQLLNQFTARMDGFRELLEVISPHAVALDQPEGIDFAMERSGLSAEGERIVRELLLSPEDAPTYDLDSWMLTYGRGDEADADNPRTRDFAKLLESEPYGVVRVLRRFYRGVVAPRTALLNGSLVTVAVASFEFLLAGLYRQHILQFPTQLDTEGKQFSLSDLAEIGSIEEAYRVLAERRVDSFMRRPTDDWFKWADDTVGFDFRTSPVDAAQFDEVFQRRHVIVHNAGLVDQRYLEHLASDDDGPEIGDELPVSPSYVASALDKLEVVGMTLGTFAWSKWDATRADDAAKDIGARIYDLLKAQRFRVAKEMSEVGSTVVQSDAGRLVIIVNGWIAAKKLGDLDSCRGSIEAWDVSALADSFRLAKACLLDDTDTALELLPTVLSNSGSPPPLIWDWPLVDFLRDDPRCVQAFADSGFQPPDAPCRTRSGSGHTPVR